MIKEPKLSPSTISQVLEYKEQREKRRAVKAKKYEATKRMVSVTELS
jgi:hypothetical protein